MADQLLKDFNETGPNATKLTKKTSVAGKSPAASPTKQSKIQKDVFETKLLELE